MNIEMQDGKPVWNTSTDPQKAITQVTKDVDRVFNKWLESAEPHVIPEPYKKQPKPEGSQGSMAEDIITEYFPGVLEHRRIANKQFYEKLPEVNTLDDDKMVRMSTLVWKINIVMILAHVSEAMEKANKTIELLERLDHQKDAAKMETIRAFVVCCASGFAFRMGVIGNNSSIESVEDALTILDALRHKQEGVHSRDAHAGLMVPMAKFMIEKEVVPGMESTLQMVVRAASIIPTGSSTLLDNPAWLQTQIDTELRIIETRKTLIEDKVSDHALKIFQTEMRQTFKDQIQKISERIVAWKRAFHQRMIAALKHTCPSSGPETDDDRIKRGMAWLRDIIILARRMGPAVTTVGQTLEQENKFDQHVRETNHRKSGKVRAF